MSAYRRMHVNTYFLDQEKGLYVDIRAKTRNMQKLCMFITKKRQTCMMLKTCMSLFITARPTTKLCARGGRRIVDDMCYWMRRTSACVARDELQRRSPETLRKVLQLKDQHNSLLRQPQRSSTGRTHWWWTCFRR